MIVWGGFNNTPLDTGGLYDPVSDSWTPTSLVDAPAARYGHTSVWSGDYLLVWGGPNTPSNVGRYAWGHAIDGDGDGFSQCDGDCHDGRADIYPGAPQTCDGINNDCNDPAWPDPPVGEIDADGDGFAACADDCDDTDAATYPGAPEINDGIDNQCPGDTGFGLIDEMTGPAGFNNPSDPTEYSGTPQPGATSYQVLRSDQSDFGGTCMTVVVPTPVWNDPDLPGAAQVFYYLMRPFTPFAGSWNADSDGVERVLSCP